MSDIDRYVSTRMLPSASGWNSSGVAHTYVRASDYDALAAQVASLRQHKTDYMEAAEQTRQSLAADNQRLLEALAIAKYRIEQGRVWNGMGWTLTGMHPLNQQKAIDAIDAALAGSKELEL